MKALHNIHRKLTLLFTGIAGLILVVMSFIYLHMSELELTESARLSFSNESNTILSNISQQNTITNRWLSETQANGLYLIALYDNGIPLSYTRTALDARKQQIAAQALKMAQEHFTSQPYTDFSLLHTEFTCTDTQAVSYYVNAAKFEHSGSTLQAVILYSTQPLQQSLHRQRLRLLCINIAGIMLLLLFSYYFTGRLLAPIEEGRIQQSAFIASASHELRTPLAVLLSQISAFPKADAAMQKQFLSTMRREMTRMSHLLNDMLLLANADNHSWSLVWQKTELDTLLLNSYEAFVPLAKEAKLLLEIKLPETAIPLCSCDPERISQVVQILLANALRFTAPGKEIRLTLSFCQNAFHISVIDHGCGISAKERKHIFDRFYQADQSRSSKEHFGLGLCIAKEIMEAHHGSITVCDTPGGGATFTLRLRSKKE